VDKQALYHPAFDESATDENLLLVILLGSEPDFLFIRLAACGI
jgi:hypothetical protein